MIRRTDIKKRTGLRIATAAIAMVSCVLFSVSAFAQCTPPSDGLVHHWTLDETTLTNGSAISDSVGSANSTVNGTMTSVAANVGTGILIDANNENINFGGLTAIQGKTELTMSAWMKRTSTSDLVLLGAVDGGYNGVYLDYWTDGYLYFGVSDGGVQEGKVALNDTEWHHVVMVYNGNGSGNAEKLKGYVDGQQVTLDFGGGTITPGGDTPSYSIDFIIGSFTGGFHSRGEVDDVRIYDRMLSADEVVALYQNRSTTDAEAGTMVYDTRHERMMYCNGTNWVHAGIGPYNPNAVYFDGANDYLTYANDLTGVTDGTTVSGSFWLRHDGTGVTDRIFQSADVNFRIEIRSDNTIQFRGQDTGSNNALQLYTSDTFANMTDWAHVMFSFDLSDTNKRHVYVNDADSLGTIDFYDTAETLDFFTGGPSFANAIGADQAGSNRYTGDISDLWIDFNTYIDLSIEANRRKFISAAGMPMYLGPDGSIPTGEAPEIFLSGDTISFYSNKGTGGAFTENGALTTASTQPASVETPSGVAYCWGADDEGQLGIGAGDDTNNQPTSPVGGNHKWVQLDQGEHSACGITSTGDAYCWGRGGNGQIGDGNSSERQLPTLVAGGHKWTDISAGWLVTCGATTTGDAYCWGRGSSGERGDGSNSGSENSPQLVAGSPSGTAWIDVTATDEHSCGIRNDGTAYCWGKDDAGELGCGGCGSSNVPEQVTGSPSGTSWEQIDGNWEFSCALRDNGAAYCWGVDGVGQLGNGGGGNSNTPSAVAGGHTFVSITTGNNHACAIDDTGDGYCWGSDANGQLGNGAGVSGNQTSPYLVAGGYKWLQLEAGLSFTCGLATSGESYCWGADTSGLLGNGATTGDQQLPNLVLGDYNWKHISAGNVADSYLSCGIIGACSQPLGEKGQMIYNPDHSVMQYCNGSEWIAMGPVGGTPTTSGLVGHWKLDETSGATITDSAGSNNGTWIDTVNNLVTEEAVTGQIDGALNFDGSNDRINIGNPAALQLTGSVSIAAWVRGESFSEIKHFVSKNNDSPDYGYALATNGANSPFVLNITATGATLVKRESNIVPSLNVWYHVVGVYNASAQTMDIYVNGTLDNGSLIGGPVPASQFNSSADVNIGRRSGANRYWNGDIDDVRIYNRALNSLEVSQIYYYGLSKGLGDVDNACGNVPGITGATAEGLMFYNADHDVMQYCNGENWIGVGQ